MSELKPYNLSEQAEEAAWAANDMHTTWQEYEAALGSLRALLVCAPDVLVAEVLAEGIATTGRRARHFQRTFELACQQFVEQR